MGTTRQWAQGRRLRALIATLGLALFATLLCAGSAQAAKPGRPTARTPNATSTGITATPTFKWSKAARTATYEVRVYRGSALQVKRTGIRRLSWKSSKGLTRGITYTWKVRGRKAGVNGRWSKSLTFTVAGSDKAITAFSFQGLAPPVIGTVTEVDHTIALTVPFGTDASALVATFATSGASVAVGGTPQVSATTANDFSSPVTYTVTAADTSTQAYVVTVTVAAAVIGQPYGGGKIAYILQPGDPGYVAGQTRGLIAATADQSAGIQWATAAYPNTAVPGADGFALGTGNQNTIDIVAQNGSGSDFAAGLCANLVEGGYSDWYLPSLDELSKLYLNRVAIGGFSATTPDYYWSSSENQVDASYAWAQYFPSASGYQDNSNKYHSNGVRAVRAF